MRTLQLQKTNPADEKAGDDLWQTFLSPASFWFPDYLVESAWLEHAPFAFWLIEALRPKVFVELGTHRGFSYSTFCQAVDRLGVGTRCYAVDTWRGDEHAGFYGDDVFDDFRTYHDKQFGGFSRLLRMTFEEASKYFEEGSIDLLHIDGRHHYQDVRDDFERWKSKLSERSVVLFHDTNVREQDFGVFKLWSELSADYPSFEFVHGHGLGVIGVGKDTAAPLQQLFALSAVTVDQEKVRNAYARLGAAVTHAWDFSSEIAKLEKQLVETRNWLTSQEGALAESNNLVIDRDAEIRRRDERIVEQDEQLQTIKAAARDAQRQLVERETLLKEADSELATKTRLFSDQTRIIQDSERVRAETQQALDEAHRELSKHSVALRDAYSELARSMSQTEEQRHAAELMKLSTCWRITAPLRSRFVQSVYRILRQPLKARRHDNMRFNGPLIKAKKLPGFQTSSQVKRRSPVDVTTSRLGGTNVRIVFVSGEAHTPGHRYRIERYASAAVAAGADVMIVAAENAKTQVEILPGADLVFVWRAEWSEDLAVFFRAAREEGARIVFDVDDLMIDPALAKREIIDGIRSLKLEEREVASFYKRVLTTFANSDYGSAPTPFLAHHMRRYQKPTFVLPNGFDEETLQISRDAVRQRRASATDELERIGYAAGTRTHQRDFAQVVSAVVRVLRERPQARLVLFTHQGEPVVHVSEFPELQPLKDQIEWREMVPLNELPKELARFDVSLAPLEVGNPFCEAKSELKYFEAALVGVPTVASPTEVFCNAIQQRVTGLLARTGNEWYQAIKHLLDDKPFRMRIAQAAFNHALWYYGPDRRVELVSSLIEQVCVRGARAAKAFAWDISRKRQESRLPAVPDNRVLYEHDSLRAADVTIVIPLHNYSHYIEVALESVRSQTLQKLDVVVVDDMSCDDSVCVARGWLEKNRERFNRILLIQNQSNSGLSLTRNVGFAYAETAFVLPLDADNILLPGCAERCLEAIRHSNAAFVFSQIEQFEGAQELIGCFEYDPVRFIGGNYIDAMALIRKAAWAAVGGFDHIRFGWEDYDFWCKLAENGMWGQQVSEVLAKYRVHDQSMLHTQTNIVENRAQLSDQLEGRHDWIKLHRN